MPIIKDIDKTQGELVMTEILQAQDMNQHKGREFKNTMFISRAVRFTTLKFFLMLYDTKGHYYTNC